MSYGYLIGLLPWAIMVLNALRPPRRPRWLARIGYFLSLVINEYPLPFLLLVLWPTLDAITSGSLLATPGGWLAFGVAVLIMTGMAYLQVRATTARPAVSAAMGRPIPATVSPWRSRICPIPLVPRNVERIANLSYEPGGREHLLDLYRHRDLTAPAPVLIYLHGGGYSSGSKYWESRPLMHRMAQRGWIVLSANYGLRPQASFPEHVIDAKRVIAWVHDNAERYGMDAATVAMAGSSAGGHMSMISALTPGDPRFQPGFEDVDTRLVAAVGFYGYYGRYWGRDRGEDPPSTPLAFDAHGAPPIFLTHGDVDSDAGVENSRALATHLREGSSNRVVYAELPGAQHGFDLLASERCVAVVDGIESFLAEAISGSAEP